MDMKPIIVMAGTPVDTQMGMDCLSTQGLPGVFCPISEDPNQQTAFQISSTEEKIDTVVSLLCAAQREHGCKKPSFTAILFPARWTSSSLPGKPA